MTSFVQREGFSDTPMQLQGELELMHALGQFFDRALYYTSMGCERERTRIGSNLRRRKDDHQKIHAWLSARVVSVTASTGSPHEAFYSLDSPLLV